jgi:hypothetical protein
MTLTLTSLPLSTPTTSIKTQIQTHLGGPSAVDASKIKILLNKKPIPSSKTTLGDAFEGSDVAEESNVTLSVMVMGGAPDPPADAAQTIDLATDQAMPDLPSPKVSSDPGSSEKSAAAVDASQRNAAAGGTATEMEGVQNTTTTSAEEDELAGTAFWADLNAFLAQRLKSSEKAAEVRGVFRTAWEARTFKP